jgi:hypothetical protein
MEKLLKKIFSLLNSIIEDENYRRTELGSRRIKKSRVLLLGQMSLLVDKKVSAVFALTQTGDMDAKLEMDFFVKNELKKLLEKNGLIFDEDSEMIFIPKNSKKLELFEFKNIHVQRLDPESVLVSKAVRAPEKNRPLLIESIANSMFPNLVSRIQEEGGDLVLIFGGEDE